jgi:hypothetical protein
MSGSTPMPAALFTLLFVVIFLTTLGIGLCIWLAGWFDPWREMKHRAAYPARYEKQPNGLYKIPRLIKFERLFLGAALVLLVVDIWLGYHAFHKWTLGAFNLVVYPLGILLIIWIFLVGGDVVLPGYARSGYKFVKPKP